MAKSDPVFDSLAQVRIFSGLTRKELSAIAALAKPFTFPAGSTLVEEGTEGGRFYLITSGKAEISIRGQTVRTLGPGSYLGEIAMIDGGPRTATVRAATDVEALGIASFNFRPLLRSEPGVAFKILVELCGRLRAVDRTQSV
jgi:CRP-like cAMP-binding protein